MALLAGGRRTKAPPRILRAHLYLVRIPLRFSVEHALAARSASTTGFLVIEADDATIGIGEVLTRDYVTGETLEDCQRVLEQVGSRLVRARIDDPVTFVRSLWQERMGSGQTGALCALELALLDLWGKSTGRSIADLLGLPSPDRSRTITFSATYPLARGVKLAAIHLFYRTLMRMDQLKVKGTGQIDIDLAYLAAVRRAFSYPVTLRLDLNGSMRPQAAGEYFTRMLESPHGVRWIEQPFPKHDLESASRFQQQFAGALVLCGDESICTEADLDQALRAGAFRAVNIRVAKQGGLLKALRIYERSVEAGMEVQLGCLVGESSVLAYAGLHLASLTAGLRHHEGCFGRFLLRWDVIRPSLTFSRGGRVSLASLPAAGLVPPFDLARLRRAVVNSTPLGTIR